MKFLNASTDPGDLAELQYRIAILFALLTLISILVFGVSDYLMGLNPFIGKVRVVYGALFLGCFYLLVRKRRCFELVIHFMLGLILAFSILNFFYNDGHPGPTIYNLLVYVVGVVIFLKRRHGILWFIAAIGSYLVIFYLSVSGLVGVVSNYKTQMDMFWDNSMTFVVCAIFIFIGVNLVITNYQKQHLAMLALKQENERNLSQLTALNEKKNHLLALLSHDLRNPTATLFNSLELAEQDILERQDLELIFSKLRMQTSQLNKILDHTLEWVSAEMDDRPAERVRILLSSLNEEMRKMMQIQASEKRQQIRSSIVGEDRDFILEINEIRIVLKNLLENAIKFSPFGAFIDLVLLHSENTLRWEVRNAGAPITEEIRRELFEFKGKGSYGTKDEKGSGIGLSLCKKIAQKLNMELGYQWVDNQNVFYLIRNHS